MARLRIFYRLCALLALLVAHGAVQACQVCVISSEKSGVYQEVYTRLVLELQRSLQAPADIALLSVSEFLAGQRGGQDARLLITLGSHALRQISAQSLSPPLLAGLLPRMSFERIMAETSRRSPTGVSALYIEQPFGRQLDLLRLANPGLRRVGVLWGPESISQQALLSSAVQARGLLLVESTLRENTRLIDALQASLRDADVLLALADSTVYNPSTVSNILLTSYRAQVPVMAFSPAYVKAGALLSVHTTADQTGAQLAAMAAIYLQKGSLPPSQYPAEFSISSNSYVARSLGLSLDDEALRSQLLRLEKRP